MLPLNLVTCNPKCFPSAMHLGRFGCNSQMQTWGYSQIAWAYARWMCRVTESTFEVSDYHNLSAGLLTNHISYVVCQAVI